ncbi:MAG: site-specific integrase [Rikenellaceae bacterium]
MNKIMASVKLKLNAQRMTKKGYPIVIQIIHKRQKSLIYTPYHLAKQEFDDEHGLAITKSRSEKKRHEFEEMNASLKSEVSKIEKVIFSLVNKKTEFSAKDIVSACAIYEDSCYLETYMSRIIIELTSHGHKGTAIAYQSAINKLKSFLGAKHPTFDDIDQKFVSDFEAFLKYEGAKGNTVNFYMRIIKAVYNRAFSEGVIIEDKRPFKLIHLCSVKTTKRAITKDIIKKIADLDLSNKPSIEMARDIFLFSFFTRGMPFVDCAFLTYANIVNGNIIYLRHKTNQKLQIKIEDPISRIIEKYRSSDCYILPIIDAKNPRDPYLQYRTMLRSHNKRLKIIGEMVGLDTLLSSYVARHSWATIAKYQGIPVSVISEGLGHSSEKTTYTYLAAFDDKVINDANETIIKL